MFSHNMALRNPSMCIPTVAHPDGLNSIKSVAIYFFILSIDLDTSTFILIQNPI